MNTETVKLVRDAMNLWSRNGYATHPSKFHIEPEDNPLCRKFLLGSGSCVGCPVFEDTRQLACDGTLYHKAFTAKEAWQSEPDDQDMRFAAQSAALGMKHFLGSLIPEATQ